MSNQKRAGVILSYLTIAVNLLIQFIYTPIMLRLLGQSEYGIYTLSNSVISYLTLFDMGFAGAYLKFHSAFSVKKDERKMQMLNGTFLFLFIIISVVALVCGLILSSQIEVIFHKNLSQYELKQVRIILIILSFSLSVSLLTNVFSAIITAHEHFFRLRFVRLISIVFSPLIGIPLMLMGFGSISLAIASLVISIWCLIDYGFYCIKKLGIMFQLHLVSRQLIVEMGHFSFFIFINEIISQINWNVDKVLLGLFYGTVMTAIYGIGSQIDIVYRTLSNSISSVFAPQVNRIIAGDDSGIEISGLFCRIGRIQWFVLAPVLLGFVGFGRYFVALWAGSEYEESYYVALLLILPVTVPMIQNIGIEIQRAMNKHQFRSIIYAIMALANICISIPLCKQYGAIGCAAGTSISLIIGNGLIMNWFYNCKLGIDIGKFWREIFNMSRGMVPAIVFIVALSLCQIKWNIFTFILLGVLFLVCYLVPMWILGLNDSERQLFSSFLKYVKIGAFYDKN